MSKKTYQIVDSETGAVVAEENIGGVRRFLYQIIASGWHRRLRWLIRGILLFCVAAVIFEPLLQSKFPTFYRCAYVYILAGLIIVFGRGIFAAHAFLFKEERKKDKDIAAKEHERKRYQVVDAKTQKVVDSRDWLEK